MYCFFIIKQGKGASKPTKGALVNIQITGRAGVAGGTGADGFAIDGVGVAVGALLARIADARVIQVAQQPYERRDSKKPSTETASPLDRGGVARGWAGGWAVPVRP